MGWEILWALILGFTLSGVIQAVVSHGEMSRLFPDNSSRSIATATALCIQAPSATAPITNAPRRTKGIRFIVTITPMVQH